MIYRAHAPLHFERNCCSVVTARRVDAVLPSFISRATGRRGCSLGRTLFLALSFSVVCSLVVRLRRNSKGQDCPRPIKKRKQRQWPAERGSTSDQNSPVL